MTPTRYNTVSIILHWLIAAMLVVALLMGSLVLAETPNSDPAKLGALKGHLIFGAVLTLLMVVRLVVKIRSTNPPHLAGKNPLQDKIAVSVQHLFYLLVILMGMSGMATAVMADLPAILFGGTGAPLPANFDNLLPRTVHGLIAALLMVLVVLHIAGALYHQLILKDNIMARMKWGNQP